MSFRGEKPVRREIVRVVAHYKEHREDLQIDFRNRCGYCGDIHAWRLASYEIDHFIPRIRNKRPFLTIKTDTDYSNLVYACKSCNNSKRNKWPTNDQNISHQNDQGFIDPCDEDYDNHFTRQNNGQIIPLTSIGKWMFKELKLYKPQHEIIWNIERLNALITETEPLLNSNAELDMRIMAFYKEFRDYINQLGDIK